MSSGKEILTILIADDCEKYPTKLKEFLKKGLSNYSLKLHVAGGLNQSIQKIKKAGQVDCIILNYFLKDNDAKQFLDELVLNDLSLPVVIIADSANDEDAAEIIKIGALDYINKNSITADSISHAVLGAIKIYEYRLKERRARKELENFAGTVAHDLKAPLNSILGFCRYIKESEKGISKNSGKLLERVISNAENMNTLILDLLQYTKIEKEGCARDPINLFDVIFSVHGDLAKQFNDMGAIFEISDAPAILGDWTKFRQLFQNLMSNSIKFCKEDKPLHIKIDTEYFPKKGHFELVYSDNGIGIQESFLTEVFKPLVKVSNPKNIESHGIGLAICRSIVENYEGEISVESEVGDGTTFRIRLPLNILIEDEDVKEEAVPKVLLKEVK